MKRSDGRRRKRRTHLVGAKMGRKNGRKKKKKTGGMVHVSPQQQNEQQQSHFHQPQQQQQQQQQSQVQQQHQAQAIAGGGAKATGRVAVGATGTGRNNTDNVIPRFFGHPNGTLFRVFRKRQQPVAEAGASSTAVMGAEEVVAAKAATVGTAAAAATATRSIAVGGQPVGPTMPSGETDQASDSESDSEIDNDKEQKQRNQVDHMKVKSGYMEGMDGIFKEKNNNKQKKTRKMDKISYDQIHIQTRTGVDSRTASTLRNGRGPQQKVVTDSIKATISGFEP